AELAAHLGGHVVGRDVFGGDGLHERLAVGGPRRQRVEGVALLLRRQPAEGCEQDFRSLRVVVGGQGLDGGAAQRLLGDELVQDGGQLLVLGVEQDGQG